MRIRSLLLLVVPAALAACVPPPAKVAPAPAAPLPPPIAAAPAPLPLSSDWRDWPLTPGDWRYASDGSARFGPGATAWLTLRCEGGSILLDRAGSATSTTVRTTALTRAVPLTPSPNGGVARLAASDPLFDAIGFSRGRFVVESAGAPPLVVPAWAEVLRVVEDCRR